ncbi:MAG TPA: dephospho-CoA kinase [Ktedonobacterales bacterium]|nr:dephospho-CoA kinase [Ktedonobacterales bacterium]
MPSILGLTGNIASGKTTIGLMLLELGATEYVDADLVVHELYLPGRPLVAQLVEAFGTRIRDAEGGVNRRVLGELVFGDPARLRQLEALVHPAVQTALIERLRALPPGGIGVLDAIKLVESGYGPLCHGLWLVTCPPEIQLRRLVETRGLTEAEAKRRLAAQPAIEPKRAVATEIIDNSGTLEQLRDQVTGAWQRFVASL